MTEREMLEAEKHWCENCCNWDKKKVQMDACSTCKLTGTRVFAQESGKDCLCFNVPAENVLVPPCKVGAKVYFNKAEIDETCPAKVIKICNNFYTPSMPLWITIEYESKFIGRQEVEMTSDVFELLCFPTKEEAEQALKGGVQE